MSYFEHDEMNGENGRKSTTLLMQSLSDMLKASGADQFIDNGKTQPAREVLPMPSSMAEAADTVQQPGTMDYLQNGQPRAQLERPACLSPKKGLLSRIFG